MFDQVVQERKRRAAARQADRVDAFQDWSKLKAVTEVAVRCLQSIDSPGEAAKRRAQERWLEVTKGTTGGDHYDGGRWTEGFIHLLHFSH